jgi:hypothetical protein
MPKKESSSKIFQCALKVVLSFFTCKAKKGRTTIKTPPHLKNANSKGSIAPATKRPMTKLADQKRTHNTNKMYIFITFL